MTESRSDAPQPRCPVCHDERHDWAVCDPCVARTDRRLAELLDLVALASDPEHLLLGSGGSGAGPIGGTREPPIGVNVDALSLAQSEVLLSTDDDPDIETPPWTGLEGWEQDWRRTLNLSPYGSATEWRLMGSQSHANATEVTLSGIVGFLRAQWPTAARLHPAADEFADDIRRMHRWALAALRMTPFDIDPDPDAQEPPDLVIACPRDLPDGSMCGHRLGVHRQPLPVPGVPPEGIHISCPRCGAYWDGPRLLLVARAAGAAVEMTIHEVTAYYGCTDRTIRRMVAAGTLIHRRGRYRVATPRHAESAG